MVLTDEEREQLEGIMKDSADLCPKINPPEVKKPLPGFRDLAYLARRTHRCDSHSSYLNRISAMSVSFKLEETDRIYLHQMLDKMTRACMAVDCGEYYKLKQDLMREFGRKQTKDI